MSVRFILGSIGPGKTTYCMDEIERLRQMQPKRRCVVLVPSHFSHETEKLICDRFGGTGLNNIEVTSFEKLARELLTGSERRLAAPGKQALISRAVKLALDGLDRSEFDGRLLAAAGRSGFVEVAASLISELHRYCVTADMLRDRAVLADGTLKQKLMLLAEVSDKYDVLLKNADYIDSDDDLRRLAAVAGGRFGAGVSVWVDKFDELLPQQLEVLREIVKSGAEVAITFTYNGEDTYLGTTAAMAAIDRFAETETVMLAGGLRHIKRAPDLAFLVSTWFDRSRYEGEVKNVSLFEARDVYTETEYIAAKILELVREDGYRFRDISVICGETDNYSHIIETVFDEYEIPYYTDERYSIADHPIAVQILSLFDIYNNNWDYTSMFEYLRAGFVYLKTDGKYRRIPGDAIDRLENYVLKYGIRGRGMWCGEWQNKRRTTIGEALMLDAEETSDAAELDTLRAAVTAPIAAYCDAADKARTVSKHCAALYDFLEAVNLYNGLRAELLGMAMNRATTDAQRFGQIWNLVLDVLDQVCTALGDSEVSAEEFSELFSAAMGQCGIRTIPSGVDRVFIGSVDKNRSDNSRVIFAAGACSGTFPTETKQEGFFSNADRTKLSEDMDIHIAPTTVQKTVKSANNVYKTLASASDRLYFSYPIQTPDGSACRPSQLVLDICAKLPGISREDDIVTDSERERALYVSTPAATLHKLLIHPIKSPLWSSVNSWYDRHGEWRHRLFAVRGARNRFGRRTIELDPELAGAMYKGTVYYSPTHLNTYAECPFKNFLQYGLFIKEREERELSAADAGIYAHEIVRRFCEEVDRGCGWDGLDEKTGAEMTEEIVRKTIENINGSDMRDKERTADILKRMGRTVAQVAGAVTRSIACGAFVPCAYEKKIDVKLGENVGIRGTIDRIDVCRHDGVEEYRVIDYKTGKKSFSVADICAGMDMQPVIYSLAITASNDRAVISGMYYNRVRNDYSHLKTTSRLSTAENELKKNTMLDGATFLETAPDGTPLAASVNRIESELARSDGSIFFGAKNGAVIGGNIRSRAAGGRLMDEVKNKIIESDRDIRGGRITPAPLTHGSGSVCDYCQYSSVCRFDEER
ncbi:MAG: exodeoxyribonuclease V subunit gamma, partial [Clostridia bacterium]|nr:exodeoxyribonuclease V subunit gamma [Clostridia bacterium]